MSCSAASSIGVVLALALLSFGSPCRADAPFLRGDVNSDGQVSIADASFWSCLLFCDPFLGCLDTADADDDGSVDLVDLITVLVTIYSADPVATIAPPFPDVGEDPTEDDLECREYEAVPPVVGDDEVRLGAVRGAPGEAVAVPVWVTPSSEFNGVQLIARYDPALFRPVANADDFPSRDEFYDIFYRGTPFEEDRVSTSYVATREFGAEGVLMFGYLIDLIGANALGWRAEGEPVLAANIVGVIAPDAESGTVIDIDLIANHDTPQGLFRNEISAFGGARIVAALTSGSVTVAETFRRGDANVDGNIDISDSIHILIGLFVGGVVIDCDDSADFNDDAAVDISDAVRLLGHLFLGEPPPSAPYPDCGVDPTADRLDCLSYPPCP